MIISIAISFLCVFSIGLFIYQCNKRIYPKSSIIILETSLVLNLISTFIFDIINKEYLIVTIISLITQLAIYIIIFAELNTLISLYKNESLAMSSDTLKIFCNVLGIIVSLGALLSLPNVFVDIFNILYFLLIVTSAVTYFSIASLFEKYNYITSRYMYNNELLHKEEKKIHIPPQDHWRCPRCNTKNSINDEVCTGCRSPQPQQ